MNIYIPWTWFATQWPCQDWFHVPLITEWQWLNTIIQWLSLSETWGNKVRVNLHMPLAWQRVTNTWNTGDQYEFWYYWSSSADNNWESTYSYRYYFNFHSNYIVDNYSSAANMWYSIRPFKNSFVVPTSWWTVINWTLGWAGIFWDQTDWIISITSDWSTWYTIADKNLWATVVYNDWDTISQSNCGYYYQRWNNYWFEWTGSITTSSAKVNAESYWPWNYYENSTFITASSTPYWWDSSHNQNLRWWLDWNVPISHEVKNIYIGEYVPPYEWPLRFTANTAGSTIKLQKEWNPTSVTLETSTDWTNWSTYTIGNTITLSNIWDKVYFRNTSTTDTGFSLGSSSYYYYFVMTWSISADWEVNYLLNKNWTNTLSDNCFASLFKDCTSLTTSPKLWNITTATNYCYTNMFKWCTNITIAPELPATTLWTYCYSNMFQNCSSLITAPELPATTAANYCYSNMFSWCTSLTSIPLLNATTLAEGCYSSMFYGCSNLETLPSLPATSLVQYCYYRMFYNCSKIKLSTTQTWDYQTAYRIPTTWTWTTATNAFWSMFYGTWWTYKSDPTINTTYYTSNTIV